MDSNRPEGITEEAPHGFEWKSIIIDHERSLEGFWIERERKKN